MLGKVALSFYPVFYTQLVVDQLQVQVPLNSSELDSEV